MFFRSSDDLASHLPIYTYQYSLFGNVLSFQGLVEFRIKGPNPLRPQLCERRAGVGNYSSHSVWVEDWTRRFMPWVKLVSGDEMEKGHSWKFRYIDRYIGIAHVACPTQIIVSVYFLGKEMCKSWAQEYMIDSTDLLAPGRRLGNTPKAASPDQTTVFGD